MSCEKIEKLQARAIDKINCHVDNKKIKHICFLNNN